MSSEGLAPVASFESFELTPPLLTALAKLNFTTPTEIQAQTIPYALQGRDIIGVAKTGSGKTAAFVLPILHKLWENPRGILLASFLQRELAFQIATQVDSLGSDMGVRCTVLTGGMANMVEQACALAKRPHFVVASPGRLLAHLKETKGFSLASLKYLVLDEADRLLDMDFGPEIDEILKHIPKERNTYLFSATMSTQVAKLQRASLRNPVRLDISSKYSTVSTLTQTYILAPHTLKEVYLVYLINSLAQNTMMVFTRTVHNAQQLAIILRLLGFSAIPLHGQLSQSARLGALNKFRSGGRSILVATDVASRGLDIPLVDIVINYDIPQHSKDYIHRVGRTARAGRAGKAITVVTQYDVELLLRIEGAIGMKLAEFPIAREEINLLRERVGEAQRASIIELRESHNTSGGRGVRKGRREGNHEAKDRDDDSHEAGLVNRPTKRSRKY